MPKSKFTSRQSLVVELIRRLNSIRQSDIQLLTCWCGLQNGSDLLEDYVPTQRGPYSFSLEWDIQKLVSKGYLSKDDGTLRLQSNLPINVSHETIHILTQTPERGEDLRDKIFEKLPYFGIRLINLDVLNATLKGRILAEQPHIGPPIQTIGYEGLSLETYLNKIIQNGGTLLCDVRANPHSRKFGFAKKALSRACAEVGIQYEHFPELGIPSEDRKGLAPKDDYQVLFAAYEKDHLPRQMDSLDRIREFVDEGSSVVLTCYEHLPQECHRHCIANALQSKYGENFTARHI